MSSLDHSWSVSASMDCLAAASTCVTATDLLLLLTACIILLPGLQPYFVVDGTTLQFPQDKNTLEAPAMPSADQGPVDGVSFRTMVFLPDAKLRYLLLCWICEPTASAARNARPVLSAKTWADMHLLASRPWNEDPRLGLMAVLGLPPDAESSQGGQSNTPTISGAVSAWLDYVLELAREANPHAQLEFLATCPIEWRPFFGMIAAKAIGFGIATAMYSTMVSLFDWIASGGSIVQKPLNFKALQHHAPLLARVVHRVQNEHGQVPVHLRKLFRQMHLHTRNFEKRARYFRSCLRTATTTAS
jgi:hypothetical protein